MLPLIIKPVLLYKGSSNDFDHRPFNENCLGKSPTIAIVKTLEGKIWGAYTDIPWGNDF